MKLKQAFWLLLLLPALALLPPASAAPVISSQYFNSYYAGTYGAPIGGVFQQCTSPGSTYLKTNQHMAVEDSRVVWTFFSDCASNIWYQWNYPYPSLLAGYIPGSVNTVVPVKFMANTTMISSAYYPDYTFTGGAFLNGVFYFDFIYTSPLNWATNQVTLNLIEFTDSFQRDAQGNPFFTPNPNQHINSQLNGLTSANATATVTIVGGTTGYDTQAVNLPNADVIIAQTENSGVEIYYYTHNTHTMTFLYSIASVTNQIVQLDYSNGYVYYAVGAQEFTFNATVTNNVKIYAGSAANGYVPSLIGTSTGAVDFAVAADSLNFYVMGVNKTNTATTWVQTATAGAMNSGLSVSDPLGSSYNNQKYLWESVAASGARNTLGFHGYITLYNTASSAWQLYTLYSQDGGVSWYFVKIRDMTNDGIQGAFGMGVGCGPQISVETKQDAQYFPENDFIMEQAQSDSTFNYGKVFVGISFILFPVQLSVVNIATTTSMSVSTVSTTVTQTGIPPLISSTSIGPWTLMFLFIVLPALIFGVLGGFFGGGRVGVVMMAVGTAVGIILGVITQNLPQWALLIMILAIAAGAIGAMKGGGEEPLNG